jgi:hypothetical protein
MKRRKPLPCREQAVKKAGARSMEKAMRTINFGTRPYYALYDKPHAPMVNLVKFPVLARKSNRSRGA